MASEHSDTVFPRIAGLPIDEAVDTILGTNESLNQNDVKKTLQLVTENGTVQRETLDQVAGKTANIVTTPETRLEFATMEYEKAQETAQSVSDLRIVEARLEHFDDRIQSIETRVNQLSQDLSTLMSINDDASLFIAAQEHTQIRETADDLQYLADELTGELESFQKWIENQEKREKELLEDIEAVDESLENIESTIFMLTDANKEISGDLWIDTYKTHKITELLLSDIQIEIKDLEEWAKRDETGESHGLDAIRTRLDHLLSRSSAIEDRISETDESKWSDEFADQIATIDAAITSHNPPVNWGQLQQELPATGPKTYNNP